MCNQKKNLSCKITDKLICDNQKKNLSCKIKDKLICDNQKKNLSYKIKAIKYVSIMLVIM